MGSFRPNAIPPAELAETNGLPQKNSLRGRLRLVRDSIARISVASEGGAAKSLLLRDEYGQIHGLGHGLISRVVWMQVVATIVGGIDVFWTFGVLEQFVEVD
jgi:hypothetical protein